MKTPTLKGPDTFKRSNPSTANVARLIRLGLASAAEGDEMRSAEECLSAPDARSA